MTSAQIDRLVTRVQNRPEGKATIKLRTLITTFGCSRRSPENVRLIQEQLAAHGVAAAFTVSSPASLDDRVVLGRAGVVAEPPSPLPVIAAEPQVPAAVPAQEPPRKEPVCAGEAAAAKVQRDDEAAAPSVDDAASSAAQPEPSRSIAARLFRAAVALFDNNPPTILGIESSSAAVPPPQAPIASEAKAKSAEEARSLTTIPVPASPIVGIGARLDSTAAPTTGTTRASVSRDLSDIAEHTIRATVLVEMESGHGSGFVVHPDGLIVTACHVVDGPSGIAQKVTVRLDDGRETTASLVRAHRGLDFALLWADTPGRYPSLSIGDARKLRYAETVLAVGHPGTGAGGMLRNTVTTGIVANPACQERGIDWIQMTTDIDPGNSGGPLVNDHGEAVGINCWKFLRVQAAKMALPLDYLHDDLAAATRLGRPPAGSSRVCTICGTLDEESSTWFCRTCGASDGADSKAE